MKFISFNVNGIRARLHQLQAVIDKHQPEVIGLQETKVIDEDFPVDAINEMGYQAHYFGQKSHYGVALLSKTKPVEIVKGYPGDDAEAQRRMIAGTYYLGGSDITVLNGYFPQGESRDHPVKFPAKQKFYVDLQKYLKEKFSPGQHLILMGDMNISPADIDIGIGDDNRKRWLRTGKCSFLPEEREWLQMISDWGLKDSFREKYPEVNDRFSWFDYRSKGFDREPKRGLRIDLIMHTEALQPLCTDAGIDYEIRGMEKPSDHCPIWAEYDSVS